MQILFALVLCHWLKVSMAAPTVAPTLSPTLAPTTAPTETPTDGPTSAPTETPTDLPTSAPTETPTDGPTSAPTTAPTDVPSGGSPTVPTLAPTQAPTTPGVPTSASPTNVPSHAPTLVPTATPTNVPSPAPTRRKEGATDVPTGAPTTATVSATEAPTSAACVVSVGESCLGDALTGPCCQQGVCFLGKCEDTPAPTRRKEGATDVPTSGTPTSTPTSLTSPTAPTAAPTDVPSGPGSTLTSSAATAQESVVSWLQTNPLYLVMIALVPLLLGFQLLTRRFSSTDEGPVNHFLPLALALRLFDTATDIAAATERVGGMLVVTAVFIVLPIVVEFALGFWLHAQMLKTSKDLSRWLRQVPFADSMTHVALVLCAFCGPQALQLLTCNLFNHHLVRAPLTKFDDMAMVASLASLLEDIPQVVISVVFLSNNQDKPSAATWLSLGVCVVSILWAIASKLSLLLVTRSDKAVMIGPRLSMCVDPHQIARVGSDGQLHRQELQRVDALMPDLIAELVTTDV